MKKFIFSIVVALSTFAIFGSVSVTYAATLRVSPETGVYTAGGTFSVSLIVNTQGKPINAADASLTFNPKELSVVGVAKGNSIFGLWTQEPTYSNGAGTISFGGGSPSGYTGSAGSIMTVTFKALGAGTPKVSFKSGSILAADGLGTNVLTTMSGGTYTIGAQSVSPEPEYIAPANTPKAPVVSSATHPDQGVWYGEKTARLAWSLPSDVVAVRTLVDTESGTIPTIVYESPIAEKTLEDLPQGISYFHIQFKNKDGWGKVTHYKIAIDSDKPEGFTITEKEDNTQNPARTLLFTVKDVSPIISYAIQIDGADPIVYEDTKQAASYTLPALPPGHHTVVVEAFDSAKNSAIASYAFDIVSFEAPVFTEYPDRVSTDVIPAFFGKTRAKSEVTISVASFGTEVRTYTTIAHDDGTFMFVPDTAFDAGVYEISAVAKDEFGAISEKSTSIRIISEVPGYMKVGSFMISLLSVIVPLFALVLCLLFGIWFIWHKLSRWKRRVAHEAHEIETKLHFEVQEAVSNLHAKVDELKESRKGKLTKAETNLIEQIEGDLQSLNQKVLKEITDVEKIVE